MIRFFLTASFLAFPFMTTAYAQDTDAADVDLAETEALSDKIDEKLSEHRVAIAKSMARVKRNLDKNADAADGDFSEEVEAVAQALEDVFADDGLFKDLTIMFTDFADDVDVQSADGVTILSFDGATVGKIERSKKRESEDSLSISGLGKNLTLDRETIVKDGKSKTRIIIEMDGGDEIEIDLPSSDQPPSDEK